MYASFEVRHPAVAGQFYPADSRELTRTVREMLGATRGSGRSPRALIVPHAGYRYSGLLAARAYAELRDAGRHPTRVALIGPAHRVPVEGLTVPRCFAFATPLGDVHVDRDAVADMLAAGTAVASDRAHAKEHSLEVQLPFLQEALGDFLLVPMLVGYEEPDTVAAALDPLVDDETLLIVSTDLSHFHEVAEARTLDHRTIERIRELDTTLYGDDACGCHAVNALNAIAKRRGWDVRMLGYRNSADGGGPDYRVVGYGAFAYTTH